MTRTMLFALLIAMTLNASCGTTGPQQQPKTMSTSTVWTPGPPTLEQQLQEVEDLQEWAKLAQSMAQSTHSPKINEGFLKILERLEGDKIRLQKRMEMETELDALTQKAPCLPSKALISRRSL